MIKGLIRFCEDYPEAKPVLLYRGNERMVIKNVLCIPCDDFLRKLTSHQGIEDAVKGGE